MNNLVLAALFICLSFFAVSAQTAKATPEAMLKSFYSWYIKELVKDKFPLTEQPTKLKQFISLRFYNEVKKDYDDDGIDADYFISAQDFDERWAKNIVISNVKITKVKGSANVLLNGKGTFDSKLKVKLVQEKGVWKIDDVEGQ